MLVIASVWKEDLYIRDKVILIENMWRKYLHKIDIFMSFMNVPKSYSQIYSQAHKFSQYIFPFVWFVHYFGPMDSLSLFSFQSSYIFFRKIINF